MKKEIIAKIQNQLKSDIVLNHTIAKRTKLGHSIEIENMNIAILDDNAEKIQFHLKNSKNIIEMNIENIDKLIEAFNLTKILLNVKKSIL